MSQSSKLTSSASKTNTNKIGLAKNLCKTGCTITGTLKTPPPIKKTQKRGYNTVSLIAITQKNLRVGDMNYISRSRRVSHQRPPLPSPKKKHFRAFQTFPYKKHSFFIYSTHHGASVFTFTSIPAYLSAHDNTCILIDANTTPLE